MVKRVSWFAAAICMTAASGVALGQIGADEAMLEQLSPAQIEKWEGASEAQRDKWRVRFQMRQESEAMVDRNAPPIVRGGNRDVGRLRYDTGAPADLFSTNNGNSDQTVGNRFTANTLTNTTLTQFTVTAMSVYGRSVNGTADPFDPGFSFFEPPSGTTAATIGYRGAATDFPASSFAPVAIGTITVPRTFLAAMYQGTFAGSDEIGMVTDSRIATPARGSTPLGFHAFQMDFAAGTATGYAEISGQNAMLRVLGPALLPVELMSFAIE